MAIDLLSNLTGNDPNKLSHLEVITSAVLGANWDDSSQFSCEISEPRVLNWGS